MTKLRIFTKNTSLSYPCSVYLLVNCLNGYLSQHTEPMKNQLFLSLDDLLQVEDSQAIKTKEIIINNTSINTNSYIDENNIMTMKIFQSFSNMAYKTSCLMFIKWI